MPRSENIVLSLRLKRGISRGTLAKTARTSVASVRRLESGATARFDEALRVAAALGQPPEVVYKAAFKVLGQFKNADDLNHAAWNDPEFRARMAEGGIDIHPAEWTIKLRLAGGAEFVYDIAAHDLDRFWHVLAADSDDLQFFIFDSEMVTVAVNIRHLEHAHVMFDAAGQMQRSTKRPPNIKIWLVGEERPLRFAADVDEPEDDEPGSYQGELNDMLQLLEMAPDGGQRFVGFQDIDGERAVFRSQSLALVAVPQWLLWGHDDHLHRAPAKARPRRKPNLRLLPGG